MSKKDPRTYAIFTPHEVAHALQATYPDRFADVPRFFTMRFARWPWSIHVIEEQK